MPADFDGWCRLATEDPQTFERLRSRRIEEAIASAPAARQQRLRCLQWRIEQERRRAPSALAACVSLSHMMWDSLAGENGLIDALHCSTRPLPNAKVLPFGEHRQSQGCSLP
jgi:hypothetical protein